MTTLSLFPARIRFTNADGTLTPEAYRALRILFARVGGALGDNGEDVFAAFGGGDIDATMGEVSARETLMQSATSDDCCHSTVILQASELGPILPDVVQPFSEVNLSALADAIHAATSKTTPVDADELPMADSAAAFSLKKLTWANLKATLKTYFDTLYVTGDTSTAWTTYTPTITTASGSITTLGSVSGRYKKVGRVLFLQIKVSITTNGTGAGTVNATLPLSLLAAESFVISGRESASTGNMLQGVLSSGSNTLSVLTYANAYPGGSGYTLSVSGVIETTT